MKSTGISGIIITRLPEFMTEEAGSHERDRSLTYEDKFYRGIDRNRWEDVENSYYDKSLSSSDLLLWKKVEHDNYDNALGLSLCSSMATAQTLLQHCNKATRQCEAIALRSPKLNSLACSVLVPSSCLEWVGWDYVVLGEWSLIAAGLFKRPERFRKWIAILNVHGLFDSPSHLDDVFQDYRAAAAEGLVEPDLAPEMRTLYEATKFAPMAA